MMNVSKSEGGRPARRTGGKTTAEMDRSMKSPQRTGSGDKLIQQSTRPLGCPASHRLLGKELSGRKQPLFALDFYRIDG